MKRKADINWLKGKYFTLYIKWASSEVLPESLIF